MAERFNRTLLGRICTQLVQSGLPFSLWGELVAHSSVQLKSSPSVAINNFTPVSIFSPLLEGHHHPIKITRFKPFGCQAYVLNHDASKLQSTARKMIMVDLEPGSNAYRLWDKTSQRVVISAEVGFNEFHFPAIGHSLTPSSVQVMDAFPDILATLCVTENLTAHIDQPLAESPDKILDTEAPDDPGDTQEVADSSNNPSLMNDQPESITWRSTRLTAPPERYGFISQTHAADENDNPTYEVAMSGPDKLLWKKAMDEEFEAFTTHNVGTLVNAPPDANVLGGMWIFSRKQDKHHRILKHKARWVIFGNHQIHGVDFFDTYASVGKSDSLRILLSIAATDGWDIIQFDIVTAFLNGDMKDVVHCRQVRGYRNKNHIRKVWQLNRSLYGSRQGARHWQEHLEGTIKLFKMKPTQSNPAVYIANDHRGILIIHLHIDDSMVMSNSPDFLLEFQSHLNTTYTVKWTPKPSLYLGIQLE